MKIKISVLILLAFVTLGTAQVEVSQTQNVGIGVSPGGGSKLQMYFNTPDGALSKSGLFLSRISNTSTSVTSYDKGIHSRFTDYLIPNGVIDSGYKIALDASSYASEIGFAGTLSRNIGVWARAGIHTASPTAKIDNVYSLHAELITRQGTIGTGIGVYITSPNTGATIMNQYDLFASSPEAKNYFAGTLGIGTTPNGNSKLQIQNTTADGDLSKSGIVLASSTTTSISTTSHDKGVNSQFTKYSMPAGVTDNGYKIALEGSSYASNNGFAGTLKSSMGLWARSGIYKSASTAKLNYAYGVRAELITRQGTIENGYGVFIESPYTGSIITNQYDLYASSAEAKNYFAGKVGIKTDPNDNFNLSVRGGIIAEEVTTLPFSQWPDYVFDPNYNLLPLDSVANFIAENHHLPEIPSAAEIEKEGIPLGEMSTLLVKKVEELTLHLIQKEDEINDLELRLKKMEHAFLKQQKMIDQLINEN